MNITEAINIMESVAGVTDESTPVGDAWALILNHIYHPPQPVAVGEVGVCQQTNRGSESPLSEFADGGMPLG